MGRQPNIWRAHHAPKQFGRETRFGCSTETVLNTSVGQRPEISRKHKQDDGKPHTEQRFVDIGNAERAERPSQKSVARQWSWVEHEMHERQQPGEPNKTKHSVDTHRKDETSRLNLLLPGEQSESLHDSQEDAAANRILDELTALNHRTTPGC